MNNRSHQISGFLISFFCLFFSMVIAADNGTPGLKNNSNLDESKLNWFRKNAVFVSIDGHDTNPGTFQKPLATLEKAVEKVEPGDTIFVRKGRYKGVTISKPGSVGKWITLRAFNPEKEPVFIDGGDREENIYFWHEHCEKHDDSLCPNFYWSIENLNIVGGEIYAVKIDTPKVNIVNNTISGSNRDLVKIVNTANDVIIFGNELTSPHADKGSNAQAVDIVGADRVWVSHNWVHDIPSIGMYAKGNAREVLFEDNFVENIYERGIMLGQSTDAERLYDGRYETYDGIIRNNLISNTGEACLASASSYDVNIVENYCIQTATRAHGSIFISNESEVKQAGHNINIKKNYVLTSSKSNRPAVKVGSSALETSADLVLDSNVYVVDEEASKATFLWEERNLNGVDLSEWQSVALQDVHSSTDNIKIKYDSGTTYKEFLSKILSLNESSDELQLDNSVNAGELIRFPYLQALDTSAMSVVWGVSNPSNGYIAYRKSDNADWKYVPSNVRLLENQKTLIGHDIYEHEAKLENLEPNTKYIYVIVGSGKVLAKGMEFKTLPSASDDKVSFVVFGDSGTEYSPPRNVRNAMSTRDEDREFKYDHDFIMSVGDIAYTAGTFAEFENNFFKQMSGNNEIDGFTGANGILYNRPFFSALGNHEYANGSSLPTAFLDAFRLPLDSSVLTDDEERYFSFDAGNAHFAVIDTMKFVSEKEQLEKDIPNRLSAMLNWLSDDLNNSEQRWKIVFFHHSIFTYGAHGTYGDPGTNRALRKELGKIFQESGVKLVFYGHDHQYMRTKPLKVDRQGKIIRDKNKEIDEENGIVYVCVGNGGGDLHNAVELPSTPKSVEWKEQLRKYSEAYDFAAIAEKPPNSKIYSPMLYTVDDKIDGEDIWGFVQVSVDSDSIKVKAVNSGHKLMDEFVIK